MELRPTHLLLREAVDNVGVKKVATALEVSTSLIYKWCQEPKSSENIDASGATNPIDRLLKIYEVTEDLDMIHYLCRAADGYYTPNPMPGDGTEVKFVTETVSILNKFADLMQLAERSLHDDGIIDAGEANRLRRNWDKLKSRLEHFIHACETGVFDLVESDGKEKKTRRTTGRAAK